LRRCLAQLSNSPYKRTASLSNTPDRSSNPFPVSFARLFPSSEQTHRPLRRQGKGQKVKRKHTEIEILEIELYPFAIAARFRLDGRELATIVHRNAADEVIFGGLYYPVRDPSQEYAVERLLPRGGPAERRAKQALLAELLAQDIMIPTLAGVERPVHVH